MITRFGGNLNEQSRIEKQLINRKSLFTEWALPGAILYGRAKSFTFGGAYNRLSTRGNSSIRSRYVYASERKKSEEHVSLFLPVVDC